MKKILFTLIHIFIVSYAYTQSFEGKWSGNLNIMGQELPIVFNISNDNNSGYITKMDSPAQNAFGIATDRTTAKNNKIEILINNIGAFFQGTLSSDSIVGTFNQNGIPFPLTLKHGELQNRLRPQTPIPPFNYEIEEITFTNNKSTATLSGTITKPKGNGKFPAVVLVAGSGPNDRDETIFEHKPFWVIADHLTRNGFMVLRYDKRGVAKSTGRYANATTLDFAEDVSQAIEYLKSRSDVDKSAIGIIGHSEGGVIAPMVASECGDVSFIILMAGMGTKGIELILEQNEIAMKNLNEDPKATAYIMEKNKQLFSMISSWTGSNDDNEALNLMLDDIWNNTPLSAKQGVSKKQFIDSNKSVLLSPWYSYFLNIDPRKYLENTKCSVLAINGDKDTQVLAEKNLSIIEASLLKGGNNKFKIKTYPNLNHLFQKCETGYVDEYIKIEETIDTQVLTDITNWILNQVSLNQ